jgi:hypothetical protein
MGRGAAQIDIELLNSREAVHTVVAGNSLKLFKALYRQLPSTAALLHSRPHQKNGSDQQMHLNRAQPNCLSMRSKAVPIPSISVAVDDFDAVAAMPDQNVYKHFLSLCNRSARTIVPQTVKWSRFSVARSPGRIAVRLFKGDQETFRLSFIPDSSS